jgi:hypothetical protein
VSDFLSHLAGRSLGPTNSVRPRFLPLFDPLPPPSTPEWREPQSSVSTATEPPFRDLELKASGSEIDLHARPSNRPPPPANRFGLDRPRVPMPDDTTAVIEPEAGAATAEISVRSVDRDVRRENSSAEHPAASSNGTRDAPHSVHSSPERARSISGFDDPPAEEAKPFALPREEIRPPANGLESRTRPAETNLIAVRSSPARPIASISSRPPALSRSLPIESAINVTIGRVEVRATLPPVAAPAPRRNAPIVSLDEYLRQRAKGAGR